MAPRIEIKVNGDVREITREKLLFLVVQGKITPESNLLIDGVPTKAAKIEGLFQTVPQRPRPEAAPVSVIPIEHTSSITVTSENNPFLKPTATVPDAAVSVPRFKEDVENFAEETKLSENPTFFNQFFNRPFL
jgi:hypothetical protein